MERLVDLNKIDVQASVAKCEETAKLAEVTMAKYEDLERSINLLSSRVASHSGSSGFAGQQGTSSDEEAFVLHPTLKNLVLNTLQAAVTPLAEHVAKQLQDMDLRIAEFERTTHGE